MRPTPSLLDVLAPHRADEEINPSLQAALEHTKVYIAWQKRKQAEARAKSVLPMEREVVTGSDFEARRIRCRDAARQKEVL